MSHAAKTNDNQRRHYRVDVTLEMRMRAADPRHASGKSDAIDRFTELHSAASRFRKELSGAGRAFVDALMATVDDLTAELAEKRAGPTGWCPKVVVEADLSAGGVGFAWDTYHALGTTLEVEFTVHEVDSSVPFRIPGVVRRCDQRGAGGFDLGVQFEEMPGPAQQRLVRMLLDLQRLQLRNRSRR
ncbi:MAG: PilZ domain-containing protein [Proteobacteria bacterium]|nr:PilZ domain-containing protein [Pseudomonadota bacterium]